MSCASPRSESPLKPALKSRRTSLPALSLKMQKSFNHVLLAMHLRSLCDSQPFSKPQKSPTPMDRTSRLSDDLLLRIFSKLPKSRREYSLVCKRWLALSRRVIRSLKVLDWELIATGRLFLKFPSLTHLDIVHACLIPADKPEILLNCMDASVYIDSNSPSIGFGLNSMLISVEEIDQCLFEIAKRCPDLHKLVTIASSETGIMSLGQNCSILQELELHYCTDDSLRGIAACQNLQVLRLIGNADEFCRNCFEFSVSDIGLTILANGCERLVKLELSRCRGGYDGIKALGQCCQMLEELSLCDHRMEGGWVAALPFCENLKTLRFQSCKVIDSSPEVDKHLGPCLALEQLHFCRCQMRDKRVVRELFRICEYAKEMIVEDCWGLENDSFRMASICRRVHFLSLEGCSLLTADSLEPVVLAWNELQRLRVVSCKNIKVGEVSPALSVKFSSLQELTWKPDSKSLISPSLLGVGIGRRGGKFFKRN